MVNDIFESVDLEGNLLHEWNFIKILKNNNKYFSITNYLAIIINLLIETLF